MPRSNEIDLLNGYHVHDGLIPHRHLSSVPDIGDRVLILHAPADVLESPGWMPDMYDMRRLTPYTVESNESHTAIKLREDNRHYNFKASWLCHMLPHYLSEHPHVGDYVWLPHEPLHNTAPLEWSQYMRKYIGGLYKVRSCNGGIIRVKTTSGQKIGWNFWYTWFAQLPQALEDEEEQQTTYNKVTVIKTPYWIGFVYPDKQRYRNFFATSALALRTDDNVINIFQKPTGEKLLEQWQKYNKLLAKYHNKKIKDVRCEVTTKHIKLHGRWKRSIEAARTEEDEDIRLIDDKRIWFGQDGNERLSYYSKGAIYIKHEDEQKIPELIRRYRYEGA